MPQQFKGVIGRSVADSKPDWPQPVRAREGAPNVLYIVLDDVGYGQISAFGGLCETPNLDRLAANGLRYRNFHTTALCSPTRTCLLTGRNHHSNAMASIVENASGFPGYTGEIPFENGFLSEMLTPHGYAAYAVGKWHLTPHHEMNMAARKDRWPLGRGFERFYGFLAGDTNQWHPDLVYDNHPIEQPKPPEDGYHLTEDLADRAIEFVTDLRNAAPDKPFFLYFCTGAAHAPHHAPKEWIEKYRGKFDKGWDAARDEIFARQQQAGIVPPGTQLTERPAWIQPWDTLSDDERRLYARMMEVFAGFVSHTDDHLGRVLKFLEDIGDLENTLTVVISDNGASAEGGPHGSLNEANFFNRVSESVQENLAKIDELGSPTTFNHYPYGWAWAGNTPFQRWKREVHEGGVADPFIMHWPAGIAARGEVRDQYMHAVDITPTVLDLLGIEPPAAIRGVQQSPIQGRSFASTIEDPAAPGEHETQYYEMLGNRAIYHRGWKAVTYHGTEGMIYDGVTDPSKSFDEDRWELYHVEQDFSESRDLAGEYPEKLRELQAIWWAEAGRYDVLPLDARSLGRAAGRPRIAGRRKRFTYYPNGTGIESAAAANVKNRSHSITAHVSIPKGGAEGVLLAEGGRFGGYSLYVKGNRLRYSYNFLGQAHYEIESTTHVPEGDSELAYSFEKTGQHPFGAGGIGRLYIDGKQVGEVEIHRTVPFMFALGGGLQCGADGGNPVTADYDSPFAFTGMLKRVVVDLSGAEPPRDPVQESRIEMARQ
ncbi:MAG: sulfatase-like hydrolase/transferase [Chloroflexota bacterium]|nr:sulfatase-like hydrolase/transferase [Chloroflexota bacterium]